MLPSKHSMLIDVAYAISSWSAGTSGSNMLLKCLQGQQTLWTLKKIVITSQQGLAEGLDFSSYPQRDYWDH